MKENNQNKGGKRMKVKLKNNNSGEVREIEIPGGKMQYFTTKEIAEKYKISIRRVQALAVSRGIGTKKGHDWIFEELDIKKFENRKIGYPRGRPRK